MYNRSDILEIKLEVLIALIFLNKIEIERRENTLNYQMIRELAEWAKDRNICFFMRSVKKPFYISGHAMYEINEKEPYKILSFSK